MNAALSTGTARGDDTPPPDGLDGRALARRVAALSDWRRAGQDHLLRQLPPPGGDVVLCLPYLLHRNDAELPGYRREATPAGIVEYNPSPAQRTALARFFGLRGAIPVAPAGHPVFVSVIAEHHPPSPAHSGACVTVHAFLSNKAAAGRAAESLVLKKAGIEAWAARRDVALRVAIRSLAELEAARAAGSTDFFLPLDRAYARGVLLAGQLPVWWLMPEGRVGADYRAAVETFQRRTGRASWSFVDLGTAEPEDDDTCIDMLLRRACGEEMSFAERIVALLTVEHALSHGVRPEPLAVLIKRAIHEGVPPEAARHEPALRLDPLRDSLREDAGPSGLRAAEQLCLSDIAFDGPERSAESERALAFWGRRWSWSADDRRLARLRRTKTPTDGHADGLRIREVVAGLTNDLANAAVSRASDFPVLRTVLTRLREWLVLNAPHTASGDTAMLLGRLVAPTRPERCVRLVPLGAEGEGWEALRPAASETESTGGWEKIGRASGLVALVAWACQNEVIDSSTRIVDEGLGAVSLLVKAFRAWYRDGGSAPVGPSMGTGVLEVVDELYVAQGRLRPDLHEDGPGAGFPVGGDWDPLNFGRQRTNELTALVHVERLAGGLCRVTAHDGTAGVLEVASRLASPVGPESLPSILTVTQGRARRSMGLRLRELFATVLQARGTDRVVLLEVGGRVFAIESGARALPFSEDNLRSALAIPGAADRLILDRTSRRLDVLAEALGVPCSDRWRVCYSQNQQAANVFVRDDTGAVHWQTTSAHGLDGHIVQLLDVLRESHPGRRRSPESVSIDRMHDGRLRTNPSSHSGLRALRKERALRVEGEVEAGEIVVRMGDAELCRAPSLDAAVSACAMALLTRMRPGKEGTPPVASARLTRDGAPVAPVELVRRLDRFRSALAVEMRRLLDGFRKRRRDVPL